MAYQIPVDPIWPTSGPGVPGGTGYIPPGSGSSGSSMPGALPPVGVDGNTSWTNAAAGGGGNGGYTAGPPGINTSFALGQLPYDLALKRLNDLEIPAFQYDKQYKDRLAALQEQLGRGQLSLSGYGLASQEALGRAGIAQSSAAQAAQQDLARRQFLSSLNRPESAFAEMAATYGDGGLQRALTGEGGAPGYQAPQGPIRSAWDAEMANGDSTFDRSQDILLGLADQNYRSPYGSPSSQGALRTATAPSVSGMGAKLNNFVRSMHANDPTWNYDPNDPRFIAGATAATGLTPAGIKAITDKSRSFSVAAGHGPDDAQTEQWIAEAYQNQGAGQVPTQYPGAGGGVGGDWGAIGGGRGADSYSAPTGGNPYVAGGGPSLPVADSSYYGGGTQQMAPLPMMRMAQGAYPMAGDQRPPEMRRQYQAPAGLTPAQAGAQVTGGPGTVPNARNFGRLSGDAQKFTLGAYGAQGVSESDKLQQIQRSLPRVGGPRRGYVAA